MWFYLGISIVGQLTLWPLFARIHYRTWPWETKTHEEDRRLAAGFWGFLWPLFIVGMILYGVFRGIGKAETTPSLKQRREIKKQLLQKKHESLPQRIKDAERKLDEARREQERIQQP